MSEEIIKQLFKSYVDSKHDLEYHSQECVDAEIAMTDLVYKYVKDDDKTTIQKSAFPTLEIQKSAFPTLEIQKSAFPTFEFPNRGMVVINEYSLYNLILSQT